MIELVYTPKWFNGADIMIDAVSILVLVLIAVYSVIYYRLNKKNKNHLFFSFSFVLIALSFVFKILTNFTLYYDVIRTHNLGLFTLTYNAIQVSHVLFIAGFLLYRMLMLLGFLTLYALYARPKVSSIVLLTFLLLVSTYFTSSSYYIFHSTVFLLLLIITLHYWKISKKSDNDSNRWLAWSFAVITLSHTFFIFIRLETWLYVVGELVQLIGYTSLLITFIKVLKDGKKERKK